MAKHDGGTDREREAKSGATSRSTSCRQRLTATIKEALCKGPAKPVNAPRLFRVRTRFLPGRSAPSVESFQRGWPTVAPKFQIGGKWGILHRGRVDRRQGSLATLGPPRTTRSSGLFEIAAVKHGDEDVIIVTSGRTRGKSITSWRCVCIARVKV
jgi:hypothetical protein